MKQPDSSLKFYLNQLHDTPLLTRDEENGLLHSIETRQNRILHECVSSPFFKAELLHLLRAQKPEDMVKISRLLNDESTPKEVAAVALAFGNLVGALDGGIGLDYVADLLNAVSISGTLIYALVTQIKKKYASISEYERKLVDLLRYFEVESRSDLRGLIENIRSNDVARAYFVRKFETTEQRLMARVHDFSEHEAALDDLSDSGLGEDRFAEIKRLYTSVVSSEAEMKRFRDELVRRNLRLVVSRAKRFSNRGLDFDDLVQEGNIGLIKAINKHDPTRGAKIGTHATWWIDQTIRRAISNTSKTVRIPTHIEFLQTQLSAAVKKLTNELGRPPEKEEIAERVKVDVAVLERLDQIAAHKVGIEDEMTTGVSMLDVLPSDPAENPFNVSAKRLLREKIRQILGTLPPRTEKIIRLRFGIGEPHEEMTLQQIAESVGLTKMGVRLVQNKGLERIRKKSGLDDELSE